MISGSCLVCRESQEHQAHTMAPADEACKSYRVSRPFAGLGCWYMPWEPSLSALESINLPSPPTLTGSKKLRDSQIRAGV